MKITLIVEGKTEKVFMPFLKEFLKLHLDGKMPRFDVDLYDGRIPTEMKLHRVVKSHLSGNTASDYIIALTDVYTGTKPPEFIDAADAKNKMRQWVGDEPRFYPHAAQYDFEAWLLPFWSTIQKLAGHNKKAPSSNPENVNHNNPPAHRLHELFRIGSKGKAYVKTRDATRILRENDLSVSINKCSELKAFFNTIIECCGGTLLQ